MTVINLNYFNSFQTTKIKSNILQAVQNEIKIIRKLKEKEKEIYVRNIFNCQTHLLAQKKEVRRNGEY